MFRLYFAMLVSLEWAIMANETMIAYKPDGNIANDIHLSGVTMLSRTGDLALAYRGGNSSPEEIFIPREYIVRVVNLNA